MSALKNTRVVMVEPIYGFNVGAACRAMMNMGLSDLAIVNPRPEFREEDARKWAYHAKSIWIKHKACATLTEAVADCGMIAGATARQGLYRGHVQSAREIAPLLLDTAAQNPVALVFGPEDNGLSNDHIAACTHLIRIPSTPEYESINLAQAVMICAYELYVLSGAFEPQGERSPDAPSHLRERMYTMWRKALIEIGFMEEPKADHMMLGLRRILSRGQMTEADVKILMGIARQINWYAQSKEAPASQEPN